MDKCQPEFLPSLYKGLYDSGCNVSIRHLTDIAVLLANIIQLLLALSGVLAIVFITWAGVQYAVSQGDPSKTKEAKNGITHAVVGLILASGAYLLVDFFAGRF
jgi:hypothetical protein